MQKTYYGCVNRLRQDPQRRLEFARDAWGAVRDGPLGPRGGGRRDCCSFRLGVGILFDAGEVSNV